MATENELLIAEMRGMVRGARHSAAFLTIGMPDKAITEGQKALAAKHGTPLMFARDVIQAIGEISLDEARAAIQKYAREWRAT